MKFVSYQYAEDKGKDKWKINKFPLHNINLLAGLSGVGKTRILNTIYNLSREIQKKEDLRPGKWDIGLREGNRKYNYQLHSRKNYKKNSVQVVHEILSMNDEIILKRNGKKFEFNGEKMPTFSQEDIGIFLLREDPDIKPIFDHFSDVYIKRLNPNQYIQPHDQEYLLVGLSDIIKLKTTKPTLKMINKEYPAINLKLQVLNHWYKDIFNQIREDYIEIFPFVEDIQMGYMSDVKGVEIPGLPQNVDIPIFFIKEKSVPQLIPAIHLSSGMLNTMTQLVTISLLPSGSVYLIDEIENSMGVRSLPILIDILLRYSNRVQFIFTTHHPYIFNNIDLESWKIVTRNGQNVTIIPGESLKTKYSKSHINPYIQLINSDLIENGI